MQGSLLAGSIGFLLMIGNQPSDFPIDVLWARGEVPFRPLFQL